MLQDPRAVHRHLRRAQASGWILRAQPLLLVRLVRRPGIHIRPRRAGLQQRLQHQPVAPLRHAVPLHVRHKLLGQAVEPRRRDALKGGGVRADHRGIHDGAANARTGVKAETGKSEEAIRGAATRGDDGVFPRERTGARDYHVVHVRRSRVWLGVDRVLHRAGAVVYPGVVHQTEDQAAVPDSAGHRRVSHRGAHHREVPVLPARGSPRPGPARDQRR